MSTDNVTPIGRGRNDRTHLTEHECAIREALRSASPDLQTAIRRLLDLPPLHDTEEESRKRQRKERLLSLIEGMLRGLPELTETPETSPPEEPTSSGNVVRLPPRANPEALLEFERRAREYFMTAFTTAFEAVLGEVNSPELGGTTLDQLSDIMHRALDDVRQRMGFQGLSQK